MPSGPQALWDKFTKHDAEGKCVDDGIDTCESIIEKAGGQITDGVIRVPRSIRLDLPESGELVDAMTYLIREWDYAHGEPIDPLIHHRAGT